MNVMKYKGYSAVVEFSSEDECFVGRVVGINDIIDFEGESVAELQQDFHNGIDSYLKTCAKLGKTPDKPYSGKMLVRLPAELHAGIAKLAEITGESANKLVVDAVKHTYFQDEKNRAVGTSKKRKQELTTVK